MHNKKITFAERLEKLNFHAKPLNRFLSEVEDLAPEIAKHTILLISFPKNREINHWKKEIQTWLTKLRLGNDLKIPGGKIKYSTLSYSLFGEPLGSQSDIQHYIYNTLDEENISKDSIDYNAKPVLDNYQISLGAIYDDYIDYIMSKMDLYKLKEKMNNYYLYKG